MSHLTGTLTAEYSDNSARSLELSAFAANSPIECHSTAEMGVVSSARVILTIFTRPGFGRNSFRVAT